jgi:hypothetical protein
LAQGLLASNPPPAPLALLFSYNELSENQEGEGTMVALRCKCGQKYEIWGEFWWVGEKHEWVFFDGLKTSETYAERLTHCPACGRALRRRTLDAPGKA